MADFNQALAYVIPNEGVGYETIPQTDQPTNTGIIASDIAEYRNVPLSQVSDDMVKSLTQDEITKIYNALYWQKIMGDQILDQGIATCIFDTCVNRGVGTGVMYAQRVCNMLKAALVVDGDFGLHTLSAVNLLDRSSFIKTYENMEAAGYLAIVAHIPADKKYLSGWQARARKLFTLI